MSDPRVLLGYIRADLLPNGTELPQAKAQLEAFADRERFRLGGVLVAQDDAPATFSALMEVAHNEPPWGIVVPDLRHLTVVEQQILARDADGGRTAIFAATLGPHAGGPGGGLQTRARPAVPPLPHRPGSWSAGLNWS